MRRVAPRDMDGPRDVAMLEDKDLGRVYLEPGFSFRGIETVLVEASAKALFEKQGIDPDELAIYLKDRLINSLRDVGLFSIVTERRSDAENMNGGNVFILRVAFSDLDPGSRMFRALQQSGAVEVQLETEMIDPRTKRVTFKASNRRLIAIHSTFAGDIQGFIVQGLDDIVDAHSTFMKRISSGGKVGLDRTWFLWTPSESR